MRFITSLDFGFGDKVRTAELPEHIKTLMETIANKGIEFQKRPHIIVGNSNKLGRQHRNVAFYSNESFGYFYSNTVARAHPLTDDLSELMDFVNGATTAKFNGILINEYDSGQDYIGAHSDDEKTLSGNAGVVSLSFGDSRIMKFTTKNKDDHCQLGKGRQVELLSGHLLQMIGDTFQKRFKHRIDEETKRERRISFTFRCHDPDLEKKQIEKLPESQARLAALVHKREEDEAARNADASPVPGKKQRS